MTARDNAETADLALEMRSLREQLKESEGKCRALTVESEGWARQLAEATALLARAHQFGVPHPAIRRDIGAFLAPRAPAQPAAPAIVGCPFPENHEGPCIFPAPAAPEPSMHERIAAAYGAGQAAAAMDPSADTVPESMHVELREVMLDERRAKERAEAQLAAVRRELRDWEAADSACQGSPRAHLEAIEKIVTAASPGAGEKRCGVTAWNRWELPCDREAGHTGTHSADPGRSGK